jgi:hypothetical protein
MGYVRIRCLTLVQKDACSEVIVQPESYNGLKYADVLAHSRVSNPSPKSPLRLSERHTSLPLSELRKAGINPDRFAATF